MNQSLKRIFAGIIGASLLAGLSLKADPITVQEVGVGANETVFINSTGPHPLGTNLHVYAGVLDLSVNGVATNGFCIDPWHWSISGVQTYSSEALNLAPKGTPSGMGTAAASQIEQLWAQFYSTSMSNINAAAMQIEIWTIVDNAVYGGADFKLDSVDHDSAAVMTEITTMANFLTSNPNAPTADLIGVTGPGQDYVIQNVPDGGTTACLLGSALVGLFALRRKLRMV